MSRVVVITGGTRGIGEAMGRTFAQKGDAVIALYHSNQEKAEALHQETGIETRKLDVSDFNACESVVEEILKTFGSIDVLINNAGITRDGFLHKMSYEDWDLVLKTNLYAAFSLCRFIIPSMRERQWGRIINISSINGLKGQRGQTNYSASKAGLLGFTKALAQEVASHGITVNAIAPGYTDTEMVRAVSEDLLKKIISEIPVKRLGKPEEIAGLAFFLASEEAAFITGATLNINGGQFMG